MPFSREAKAHTSPSMALEMQKVSVPLNKRGRLGLLGNSQTAFRFLFHSQALSIHRNSRAWRL